MSNIIKYRINSVTSQSPNYPASNLTNQNSTLGWQTQYSPTYPQQINIQFFTPIRTKHLKMVFHQYKIPSCVEIFVRLTNKQNYRKLGYTIPNDNSQSSHEHKQIKTLYFEFPCNYIKLVFYQNYKNQMNLFEQVALQQLVVEGQAMTYNEIRNLDLADDRETSDDEEESTQVNQQKQQEVKKKPKFPMNELQQTGSNQQLSKKFNEVYSYLENQKAEAVQNQDFKLAAHLKNAIQAFKDIQSDINNLQHQKRQALQDEDFDKCHRIKQQISKKKQQFAYRTQQLISNEQNFMAQYSHSRIYQDNQQQMKTDKKTEDIRDYFSSTPERQPEKSQRPKAYSKGDQQVKKSFVDHNEQILPAVRNKMLGIKTNQIEEYPTNNQSNRSQLTNRNRQKTSKSPKNKSKSPPKSPNKKNPPQILNIKSPIQQYKIGSNYEQQQNGPLSSKSNQQQKFQFYSNNQKQQGQLFTNQNKPQLPQLTNQKFKHLDLQPLDLKLRLKIQNHFAIIQQPYWQMIMNKKWIVKKQALEYVIDNVVIGNKQSYLACMEFVSYAINDIHPQNILLSLSLLRKIVQEGDQNQIVFSLPHLPFFVEEILTALLNLIPSTNKQISQQSYNVYLLMGMINFLSIQQLIQKIIKHKQTAKILPQHILLKIGLMILILEKYNQSTKYYKQIVLWAMTFLEDPNNKVRSEASYILLILTDIVGEDKIIAVFKDKPKMLESFYNVLNASHLVEESKLDQNSRITERNLSKLEENNNSILANKSRSKQRQKNVSQGKGGNNNFSQNASSLSNRASDNNKKLNNPWNSKRQQQKNSNRNSKMKIQQGQNEQQQLEYSKQSDFYGSSIKKSQHPSNVYYQRGYQNQQFQHQASQGDIRVLEDDQEQYQKKNTQQSQADHQNQVYDDEQNDPGKCDFCFMDLNGLDQRQHLMTQCKVIAYCEQCMGRIYIRQIIEHLMFDCPNKNRHQQCKRCGVVFNIEDINQHVGQGICRLQRGQGWERCQFCGQDVLANDNKWVEHAYKCPNLPEPAITETQNATQKNSDD